jgi:hypothetical protein
MFARTIEALSSKSLNDDEGGEKKFLPSWTKTSLKMFVLSALSSLVANRSSLYPTRHRSLLSVSSNATNAQGAEEKRRQPVYPRPGWSGKNVDCYAHV